VTWIAVQPLAGTERFQIQPVADDLYSGRVGIAVFLAALHRVTGESRFAEFARLALPHSGRLVERGPWLGIGGTSGAPAIAFGFGAVGRFLEQRDLIASGRALAESVRADALRQDDQLDVIGGCAGTILCLLALHGVAPSTRLVEAARAAARRLLARRGPSEWGPRAWRCGSEDRPMLTGFAHGASGIALALHRLARVTGDGEVRSAADEALSFVDVATRGERGPQPVAGWCHGAAGRGLAALAVSDDEQRALVDAELASARGGARTDRLCCGEMAVADFLLTAGQRLGRPELVGEARQRALGTTRRAAARGGYRLGVDPTPDDLTPGLFLGAAGVGYELLRLADPASCPSLLLWELPGT
jgi:lantibiotic modifying enzyme